MVRAPYQRAWALCVLALSEWEVISGESAFRGVDLKALPIVDLLSAVYYWLIRHASKDQREEIESHLQGMPAPDLYAWRRVLPKKKGSSAGTTMSMDEIRALQGLPGVNVD